MMTFITKKAKLKTFLLFLFIDFTKSGLQDLHNYHTWDNK